VVRDFFGNFRFLEHFAAMSLFHFLQLFFFLQKSIFGFFQRLFMKFAKILLRKKKKKKKKKNILNFKFLNLKKKILFFYF